MEVIKMTEVTKDTLIGEILDADSGTVQFFLNMGMHCLGCPSARGESLEMACSVHGVDADELVDDINAYLASK
jgi:hybrid cluster-associated redox disulfide protein